MAPAGAPCSRDGATHVMALSTRRIEGAHRGVDALDSRQLDGLGGERHRLVEPRALLGARRREHPLRDAVRVAHRAAVVVGTVDSDAEAREAVVAEGVEAASARRCGRRARRAAGCATGPPAGRGRRTPPAAARCAVSAGGPRRPPAGRWRSPSRAAGRGAGRGRAPRSSRDRPGRGVAGGRRGGEPAGSRTRRRRCVGCRRTRRRDCPAPRSARAAVPPPVPRRRVATAVATAGAAGDRGTQRSAGASSPSSGHRAAARKHVGPRWRGWGAAGRDVNIRAQRCARSVRMPVRKSAFRWLSARYIGVGRAGASGEPSLHQGAPGGQSPVRPLTAHRRAIGDARFLVVPIAVVALPRFCCGRSCCRCARCRARPSAEATGEGALPLSPPPPRGPPAAARGRRRRQRSTPPAVRGMPPPPHRGSLPSPPGGAPRAGSAAIPPRPPAADRCAPPVAHRGHARCLRCRWP